MTFKSFFHLISYLQYPFMFTALYYIVEPILRGIEKSDGLHEILIGNFNSALIFMGLAISFASLQDTTKTQNNFSKKIWEDPFKGKVFIVIMCIMIIFILMYGLIGYFISDEGAIKNLAVGSIVLGLGLFGLLKSALEMFAYHRKDLNP